MATTVICYALGVVVLDYSGEGWVARPPGTLATLARFDDDAPPTRTPAPGSDGADGADAELPAVYDGDDAQPRPAPPARVPPLPLERVVEQALRGVMRATFGR